MGRYFRAGAAALSLLAGLSLAAAQDVKDVKLRLSAEQRTVIFEKLVREQAEKQPGIEKSGKAPAPGQHMVVGAVIPSEYEIREMPADTVAEIPALQAYNYTVLRNQVMQVMIVDPRSRTIVEIITQ